MISKRLVAVPAIAMAADLGLAACGGGSGPALNPATATASQVCNSMVGHKLSTGDTINNTTYAQIVNQSKGGEAVNCDYILNTGVNFPARVQVFANGSIGLHGV